MAFEARYLKGNSIGVPAAVVSKSLREWRYSTPDAASAVATPGYFAAAAGIFQVGDTIVASVGLGSDPQSLALVVTGLAPLTIAVQGHGGAPLRRLQAALRASRGKVPVAPASAATITISTEVNSGTGTSQIASKVDHLFTTTDKFSVYNKENWYPYVNTGTQYYAPPLSGTERNSMACIAFRYEGAKFEIMARSGDTWFIFADGEPIHPAGGILLPYVAGYAVRRLTADFGARATRNIVCYGLTTSVAGISIGPTDTIAPIDLAPQVKVATMSDSYGQGKSSWAYLGPFGEAAMRLLGPDTFPLLSSSAGGGSGYLAPGTGGNAFLARVPNIVQQSPDLLIFSGGINDNTVGLQAATAAAVAAARTALPNAVIATVGVWTPSTSYLGSGISKHDMIFAALQGISGPWVDIDVTRGIWTNSAGANGRVGSAPWVTGVGKDGSPAGTGNADFITSTDGIHPKSPDGHDLLAGHLWQGLRTSILGL